MLNVGAFALLQSADCKSWSLCHGHQGNTALGFCLAVDFQPLPSPALADTTTARLCLAQACVPLDEARLNLMPLGQVAGTGWPPRPAPTEATLHTRHADDIPKAHLTDVEFRCEDDGVSCFMTCEARLPPRPPPAEAVEHGAYFLALRTETPLSTSPVFPDLGQSSKRKWPRLTNTGFGSLIEIETSKPVVPLSKQLLVEVLLFAELTVKDALETRMRLTIGGSCIT